MAFITVGMGGGTGTGGAPIIAKICKDLGILTVGIVTTPFGFEGPRRQKQAEEGINQLKPLVDTLLVISNDKLRVQYGNLKMKEAFTKADNVLATAAKCITDVINSRGHIIVDFADVCTVMKNGGVAILGKAEVEGENRAQRAIEEALNSPLLNDNDIKGAKWILLNINSAEGDFECSMDELEVISNILRERTGENSDVIMGSGYDDTLGEKIGITLIATGFEGKDPFKKEEVKKEEAPMEDKIVVTLATDTPEPQMPTANDSTETEASLNENNHFVLDTSLEAPVVFSFDLTTEEEAATEVTYDEAAEFAVLTIESAISIEAENDEMVSYTEEIETNVYVSVPAMEEEISSEIVFELDMNEVTVDMGYSFILNKPANIYAENETDTSNEESIVEEVAPVMESTSPVAEAHENEYESSLRMAVEEEPTMQLVVRDEHSAPRPSAQRVDMPLDDSEEQRRKVRERIQKLRNLSFNISNDPNAEFDEVPAYVRRNMDLFGNTLASVENYYSKYTVDQDENNNGQISTLNTFLDGKKPD
jgi:cell division protein FtsZ